MHHFEGAFIARLGPLRNDEIEYLRGEMLSILAVMA